MRWVFKSKRAYIKSVLRRGLGFFDLNFSLSYTAVFSFRHCSCFAFTLRDDERRKRKSKSDSALSQEKGDEQKGRRESLYRGIEGGMYVR